MQRNLDLIKAALFALVLAAALTLIVVGVAMIYEPAAWIIAGLGTGVLGYLVLGDA